MLFRSAPVSKQAVAARRSRAPGNGGDGPEAACRGRGRWSRRRGRSARAAHEIDTLGRAGGMGGHRRRQAAQRAGWGATVAGYEVIFVVVPVATVPGGSDQDDRPLEKRFFLRTWTRIDGFCQGVMWDEV